MVDILNLSGVEKKFSPDDTIVSKTNEKGIITYVNETFLDISEFREDELLGKPHNMIRHPAMPRAIFRLLWNSLKDDQEIFTYVLNRTKFNNYYWVLAHVAPTHNEKGEIIGYHSVRRVPNAESLAVIKPLYKRIKQLEDEISSPKEATDRGFEILNAFMKEQDIRYDKYMYKLQTMLPGGFAS